MSLRYWKYTRYANPIQYEDCIGISETGEWLGCEDTTTGIVVISKYSKNEGFELLEQEEITEEEYSKPVIRNLIRKIISGISIAQ